MSYKGEKYMVSLYEQASNRAEAILEREARKILRAHKRLDEFVMGMGGWFFTVKIGSKINGMIVEEGHSTILHEPPPYAEKLAEFITDCEKLFSITGTPMRFTANGPVVTEW